MKEDRDRFLEKIDELVLDEWLEETYGYDAKEKVDLDVSMTKTELSYLVDALIDARNDAVTNGNFIGLVMHDRLLRMFLDVDSDIKEQYESAQQSPQAADFIQMLMGGGR